MNTIRTLYSQWYTMCFIAFILVCPTQTKSEERLQQLRKPVVLVYGGPRAKGVELKIENIDQYMKSPNVIEIGPSILSHPGGYEVHQPLLNHWKQQDKLLLRRVYTVDFKPDGSRHDYLVLEELIRRWTAAMQENYVDGISIDEFDTGKYELVHIWITALQELRKRFPNKYIFCWSCHQLRSQDLLTSIRDFADYIIPEIYYKESDFHGSRKRNFHLFRTTVEQMSKLAPGIEEKILIGIGTYEAGLDDIALVDFGEFVDEQIQFIARDQQLRCIAGIALFAPMHARFEYVQRWDETITQSLLYTECLRNACK